MGSDFWDPLDVAVFTTWVVDSSASRFGDSSIGDTCGTISPSFFRFSPSLSTSHARLDFEPRGNPKPSKLGVILDPNFLRVCFFGEVEGQEVEVGGNTAAQYSL